MSETDSGKSILRGLFVTRHRRLVTSSYNEQRKAAEPGSLKGILFGGRIASLVAAVYLVKDAGVDGAGTDKQDPD